jgi:hypothetical protein
MNREDILRSAARAQVKKWITDELTRYADTKWDMGDSRHSGEKFDTETYLWWEDFVMQYLSRARILGADIEVGQQALLKALTTLFEMCVTMTMHLEQNLPDPGHPSGEIR